MEPNEITAGHWVEYADAEVYKGQRVPVGTRFGMVATVKGSTVRLVTNSPKPTVIRVPAHEVLKLDRPVRVGEVADRITKGLRFGSPKNAIKALRQVREAVRGARP